MFNGTNCSLNTITEQVATISKNGCVLSVKVTFFHSRFRFRSECCIAANFRSLIKQSRSWMVSRRAFPPFNQITEDSQQEYIVCEKPDFQ